MSEQPPELDVQSLVDQAMAEAMAGVDSDDSASGGDAASVQMPEVDAASAPASGSKIELLSDVDLHVKIELGRTQMLVEDVLRLGEGAVVELDKLAGDPVDVYVNDQLVARGEVLVLNDNFCIRVSEIVASLDQPQQEEALAAAGESGD